MSRAVPRAAACAVIGLWSCALALGCASSGAILSASAMDGRIAAHDTVVVVVESDLPNSDRARQQLPYRILSGLNESGRFARLEFEPPPDAPSYLLVTARITKLRTVSDVARVLVGGLAGRASILVDVELTDHPSASSLATFQAEGKSSAGSIWCGTTEQAVQRAAEQFVAKILEGTGAPEALSAP